MSKVISFRTTDDIYNYFKNLEKPFSQSIPPILHEHIKKTQNKTCIQPVCNDEIDKRYQRVSSEVNEIIGCYFEDKGKGDIKKEEDEKKLKE